MIKLFCAHALQCVGDNLHRVEAPGLTFMFLSWLLRSGYSARNDLSEDELRVVIDDLMIALANAVLVADDKTGKAEYSVMLRLLKK